ncbi:MAG: DUF3108 domain-containing protein [Caldimicrobium sp.]|jgi:hypothetical protein
MILLLILFILLFERNIVWGKLLLYYEIFYGPLKLGESKIIVSNKEYKAIAYTTKLGDLLYPYYFEWTTTINEKNYPLTSIIYSKDRFKERKKIIYFEQKKNEVIVEKILPKPKKISYQIPSPIFDELSSFVYSWKLDYFNKNDYQLPIYIDGERHFVYIKYSSVINCKFNNQTQECINLLIHLPEKSELLKRSKNVQIFLSKKDRIPIEIMGSLPIFGNLRAILKEVKNL